MNFAEAVRSGFANYVNFSGRAIRSEYWYWVLFTVIASVVTMIIDMAIGSKVTSTIWDIATCLPSLAVAVRRLHDLDRSGWWFLLIFIPLIGIIFLIVWFCDRGTIGPNRFGPDPLAGMAPPIPRSAV